MTEIARLPFGRPEKPEECGALVLSDGGAVQIEASDAMRDALAEREEAALALADRYGKKCGLAVTALGLTMVAAGWYAGRVFGKSAGQLLAARSVMHVELTRTADGCLKIRLGKTNWSAGECSAPEVEQFLGLVKEMQQ